MGIRMLIYKFIDNFDWNLLLQNGTSSYIWIAVKICIWGLALFSMHRTILPCSFELRNTYTSQNALELTLETKISNLSLSLSISFYNNSLNWWIYGCLWLRRLGLVPYQIKIEFQICISCSICTLNANMIHFDHNGFQSTGKKVDVSITIPHLHMCLAANC